MSFNSRFEALPESTQNKIRKGVNDSWNATVSILALLGFCLIMANINNNAKKETPKGQINVEAQSETRIKLIAPSPKAQVPDLSVRGRILKQEPKLIINTTAKSLSLKIDGIRKGNKIDELYIQTFYNHCKNWHSVISILAISGHETQFGKTAPNYMDYNFYGFFKNGNKRYNPSLDQLASDLCLRFNSSNFYHSKIINQDGIVNVRYAKVWSGNDRATNWSNNVMYFYKILSQVK